MPVIFQAIPTYRLHVKKDDQIVPFTLVDATDLKTLEAGVTTTSITISVSINGASYGAPNDGVRAEVGHGDYTVRLDQTDTGSLGYVIVRAVASGISAESRVLCIVGIDAAEEATMAETIRRMRREMFK